MTIVEQALAASPLPMTLAELAERTGMDQCAMNPHIRALADAGRLEHIPGRGKVGGRYALRSIPAAQAAPQPEVGVNTGSAAFGIPTSPEGRAVEQTPEPESDATTDDGSGGNVFLTPELQYLAPEDYEMPPADPALLALANRHLSEECDRLRCALDVMRELLKQSEGSIVVPPAYLLRVAKRKPRIIAKAEAAKELAMAAVRNGAGRAEVYALVPVGFAKRGAEWEE